MRYKGKVICSALQTCPNFADLLKMCALFLFACTSLLIFSVPSAHSLRFHLKPGTSKCLRDEAHRNLIVRGEYDAVAVAHHETNIIVRDIKKHVLYQRDNIEKGKFAFTTENFEVFEICFETKPTSESNEEREIFLDVKHGVEAKNFEQLAQVEKLKPIEVELKRLEGLADEIVEDFDIMHKRSKSMRKINESTHRYVLYFSIISMVILVVFACWQVIYLRQYFKSKKLIE